MNDVDILRQTAEGSIMEAFPVGAPPTAEEMRNDHCPECREVAELFTGKVWMDVRAADLRGNPPVGLLSVPGWRYYLPAFLLRCVQAGEELDVLPDEMVSELSPPGRKPHGHCEDKLAGITRDQIAAILAFLRWREACERADWSQPDWPKDAVDAIPIGRSLERAIRYWDSRRNEGAA